jgi:hypothetical protein
VAILEQLAKVRTLFSILIAQTCLLILVSVLDADASGRTISTISAFGLLSMALWWVAWLTYLAIYYRRIGEYQWRGTPVATRLPEKLLNQHYGLSSLGFTFLGDAEYRYPWQRWKREWVYAGPDGRVGAVVGVLPTPAFISVWPDGRYLVTARGSRFNSVSTGNSKQIFVGGTYVDAYRSHIAMGPGFRPGSEEPTRMDTVADVVSALAPQFDQIRAVLRKAWLRPRTALFTVPFVIAALAGLSFLADGILG